MEFRSPPVVRRPASITACVVAVVFMLAGCGGGGGGASVPAPVTPVTPPVVVTPPEPQIQTKPTMPVPAGLWTAAPSALPTSGNYIHFSSEMGATVPDFVGAGLDYTYSDANNDDISVTMIDGRVHVVVLSPRLNTLWWGDIAGMNGLNPIQAGYYSNAQRYPFQDSGRNALAFYNGILGRACNVVTGWFAIDSITFSGQLPASIDFRFEQHCEGHIPGLHGQVHWVFDNTPAPPPGPIAIPADLWRADATAVPASHNYVYMKSDLGDFIGDFNLNPTVRLYTPADARIDVTTTTGAVKFEIAGDLKWEGVFAARAGLPHLLVGFYGGLGGTFPVDPARGGMNWMGDSRSTGALKSWYAIDKVEYDGDTLTLIDLRFEQHGGGARPALRGQIHWSAADTLAPPGPQNPPPATLWQPAPGSVPTVGNFLYLASDPNDFVGAGRTTLHTPANSQFDLWTRAGELELRVNDADLWIGTFEGLDGVTELQPGYYAGVKRSVVKNPTKGGMDFDAQSRGCNQLTGWFAIDKITYVKGEITALELRFEQRCEGAQDALRGAYRWVR